MTTSSSPAAHASLSAGIWRRAWAASLAFHLTATIILGVLVQQLPRSADLGAGTGMVIDLSDGGGRDDGGSDAISVKIEPIPASPQADATQLTAAPPVELGTANPAAQLPQFQPITAATNQGDVPTASDLSPAGSRTGSLAGTSAEPPRPPRFGAGGGSRFEGLGGGSRSTVEVFGVKGSGSKFVYLFDRSTSMDGPPLAAAKRQLIESLQALKSINQFQIIFFNSRPYPIDITGRGRMAFADDRSKRMAASLVGNVTAELGTDRYSALKAAIAYQPDVIFFLTDADDAMLPSEIAEIGRANERTGAAICVIEFGRDPRPPRDNFLMQLARESGGQYGYVNASTLGR